jgi:hypothetical protein
MRLEEAVRDELDRLIGTEQGRPPARAQYGRQDFQRLPGTAGRYRNLQTGETVSRRQHDKLIGRPLPRRTRAQALRRVAERLRQRGLKVTQFEGHVRNTSGKQAGQVPHRTLYESVAIEPGQMDAMAEALERNDAEAFATAFDDTFFESWWGVNAGTIADVDEGGLGFAL